MNKGWGKEIKEIFSMHFGTANLSLNGSQKGIFGPNISAAAVLVLGINCDSSLEGQKVGEP